MQITKAPAIKARAFLIIQIRPEHSLHGLLIYNTLIHRTPHFTPIFTTKNK